MFVKASSTPYKKKANDRVQQKRLVKTCSKKRHRPCRHFFYFTKTVVKQNANKAQFNQKDAQNAKKWHKIQLTCWGNIFDDRRSSNNGTYQPQNGIDKTMMKN